MKKQRQYREMLQNQIKDQQQRKLYKNVVMSEYERRVNAGDIQAYENMSPVIHGKVVGIRAPEEVEKMSPIRIWRKSTIGNTNENSTNSLNSGGSGEKAYTNSVNPSVNYQLELAKKLNGQLNFNKPRESLMTIANPKVPSKLAEIAAKNMEDPSFKALRSNTYNNAYGYKPSVNYQPPQLKERPSDQKRNDVNYSAIDVRTLENARIPSRQRRDSTSAEVNRSFVQPKSSNTLADAAKVSIIKPPDINFNTDLALDQYAGKRVVSSSVDDKEKLMKMAEMKYKPRERDVGKMRPAGASRRQAINYNIITGQ